MRTKFGWLTLIVFIAVSAPLLRSQEVSQPRFSGLREVNPPAMPNPEQVIAIVNGQVIDGMGGKPIAGGIVVVRGHKIAAVGNATEVHVPSDAVVFDAAGKSVLPGLVDSHFHTASGDTINTLPPLFLSRGVTTARDPGRPIEVYDRFKDGQRQAARLFLTGPHYDQPPFAWPDNAVGILSETDAARKTQQYAEQGGTGIKVYYRLPLRELRATCAAAHSLGVPVTAHLELVDADLAIAAGLDGIEHITSLGTVLADTEIAERFRESVYNDNEARKDGRYRLWASLSEALPPRGERLSQLMAEQGTYLSPTLATFERRAGEGVKEYEARGFENMLKVVGLCHRHGVHVVTGSHTWSKYVPMGLAFQREMELLHECGLSTMDVIRSSTLVNAQFLGCGDRVGSLEAGKLADIVIVDGDPLDDIASMRNVWRVMQNGNWISPSN